MGYNIHIGEAYIKYLPEDNYIYIAVIDTKQDTAPDFGFNDVSGKSNSRYPNYTQMSDFCKDAGIYELFYDEYEGLLKQHPGCRPITQKHLQQIVEARVRWEKEHPNCKEMLPYAKDEPSGLDYFEMIKFSEKFDWTYARLVWYEFWFDWALKNCKMPSIANG